MTSSLTRARAVRILVTVFALSCGNASSPVARAVDCPPSGSVALSGSASLLELSSRIPAPVGGYAFALHPSTVATALASDTWVPWGASMTLIHVDEGGTPLSVVSQSILTAAMRYVVPDAALIPIPPGVKPVVGDLVRVSGTPDPLNPYLHEPSFGYGIVTSAREGEPATYRRLDSQRSRTPSPRDERPLPDHFFLVLTGSPWEPGSHVAYRADDKARWSLATVIRVDGDNVVLLADRLVVATRNQVRLLPLRPNVKPGDRVYALEERDSDVAMEVIAVDTARGLIGLRHPRRDHRAETRWAPFGTISVTPL